MGRVAGLLLLLATLPAAARQVPEEARRSDRAGKAAYEAGHFAEAIADYERALALYPAASVRFSLAQACRRQYDVDGDQSHLVRAMELYRTYLDEVPGGGRRAHALKFKEGIEALLAAPSPEGPGAEAAPVVEPMTAPQSGPATPAEPTGTGAPLLFTGPSPAPRSRPVPGLVAVSSTPPSRMPARPSWLRAVLQPSVPSSRAPWRWPRMAGPPASISGRSVSTASLHAYNQAVGEREELRIGAFAAGGACVAMAVTSYFLRGTLP